MKPEVKAILRDRGRSGYGGIWGGEGRRREGSREGRG